MAATGYALFATAVGRCGVAWGDRGIVAVQLPERTDAGTRARLLKRGAAVVEGVPPPAVQGAIDGMTRLLDGEPIDLTAIALDMDGVPAFPRRVYEIARAIPPGATLTYGDVANRTGVAGSARAVGQALGKNPFAIVVPCHRVVGAGGVTGGFSAQGGAATKRRMLTIEGALPPALFDADGLP
jgi:methylated-DNA-[protein]-cysteine S-methyltransferase